MPRSRGSELSQKPSPRGPPSLRTPSSDSDLSQPRQITDRSPKISDRRSPRSVQPDPVNQKKLGTRIADLESQLGNAQDELRNLKNQLASAEAAKKEAQEKLEKKAKKPGEKKVMKERAQESNGRDRKPSNEITEESLELEETDVFEVPIEKTAIEPKSETTTVNENVEKDSEVEENLNLEKLSLKDKEIKSLRETLEEKEKEALAINQENETLKTQLKEATLNVSSARSKEEEMTVKLSELVAELEASKLNSVQLIEQLKSVEESKELLESEMKKIRVQTEQWRKAADAAAAILAGSADMTGRIPGRCGSMDKHFNSVFETGFIGSPADDADDGFGSGKRKGSGIKMFGDLWRKKGQK